MGEYDHLWDEIDPHGLGPHYFDREGEPITMRRWCELRESFDYIVVAKTLVQGGALEVSTVWLGLDHSLYGGGLEIFETMVFETDLTTMQRGPFKGWQYHEDACDLQQRYATEAAALAGHDRVVEALTLRLSER